MTTAVSAITENGEEQRRSDESHFAPHPAKLLEPLALALVPFPEATYELHSEVHEVTQRVLSGHQHKTLLRLLGSIARHRCFFLGDGTGTGKSRIIGALCLENCLRGRDTAWVTANLGLVRRARQELELVFRGDHEVLRSRVRVLSYRQLRMADYSGDLNGSDGLDGWTVVLDEAHQARNDTACRSVVDAVQSVAANVVYATATPASDITNIGYMHRLSLWGPRTCFEDFSEFCKALKRWGVAAMELLSIELKRAGKYSCFKLDGDATAYARLACLFSPTQKRIFDKCSDTWAGMQVCSARKGLFFRRLVTIFKTVNLLALLKEDLRRGYSVIVSVQGTGAAKEERSPSLLTHIAHGCDVPSFSGVAPEVRGRLGPTEQWLFDLCAQPGVGSQGHQAERRYGGSEYFSMDPIDVILAYFGGDVVAEISGRRKQLQHETRTTHPKPSNAKEAEAFRTRTKQLCVLSSAGALGIDLNPPVPLKHYFLELPWAPEAFIQQSGRSSRANNAHFPQYYIVDGETLCETRVTAALAKRARTLGAVTEADRNAHGLQMCDAIAQQDVQRILRDFCLIGMAQICSFSDEDLLFLPPQSLLPVSYRVRTDDALFEAQTLAGAIRAFPLLIADGTCPHAILRSVVAAYIVSNPDCIPLVLKWSPVVHSLFPYPERRRVRAVLLCHAAASRRHASPASPASSALASLPATVSQHILEYAIGEHFDARPTLSFLSTRRPHPWDAGVADFLNCMSFAPLQVQQDICRSLRRARSNDDPGGRPRGNSLGGSRNGIDGNDQIQTVVDYCLKQRKRDGYRCTTSIEKNSQMLVADFRVQNICEPLVEPPLLFTIGNNLLVAAKRTATEHVVLVRPGRASVYKTLDASTCNDVLCTQLPLNSLQRFREQEASHIAARRATAGGLSRRLAFAVQSPFSYWDRSKKVVLSGVDSASGEAFVGLLVTEYN